MEAQIERIQEIFSNELEYLKNKQTEMDNRVNKMKKIHQKVSIAEY